MQWNQDDLGYDFEPERTLLRRRREARRRARQATLEQQLNMAAEHHDDNLNLENNQNRVTLGQYINPTADSCGSTIRRPVIQANNFELKPSLIQLVQQDQFSHSSEACAAIQDQQSIEQMNYMGNAPRQPNFDLYSKTFNPGHEHLLFIDFGSHWCIRIGALGAYTQAPFWNLGVPPKSSVDAYALVLGCVHTGCRIGLQVFLRDFLVPFALFSHFCSDLCLFRSEILEQTYQGIERNGKRSMKLPIKMGFINEVGLGQHRNGPNVYHGLGQNTGPAAEGGSNNLWKEEYDYQSEGFKTLAGSDDERGPNGP
ncbi:hypothetical protein PIB30_053912 [Stylosanthes scabra]|uniref:Uncharacterized protein n=2 Tax=Stylosanthes scabra TaxID=79078 RepID=A0ABU6YL28_9FABA|nr:hypothetical protein [Stylosanthes scabra]